MRQGGRAVDDKSRDYERTSEEKVGRAERNEEVRTRTVCEGEG